MIHFVGAGPGAVDLITVRGAKLLSEADVVIYAGSLVNPQLLDYCKKDARIYNSAEMTLEDIVKLMDEASSDGREVVRLHTGDASIYGAIREQMEYLDKKSIPYDTTPGVSACFGAAAQLNLEYTLPDISQSLIITRMEGKTKVPKEESIESFAKHKSSMAIYLSAFDLGTLSKRLINGGLCKDTPCALCYKATWPEERSYICTLETLEETAKRENITKTALVLVGDVISKSGYSKSRLYAADFSTEYRKATK